MSDPTPSKAKRIRIQADGPYQVEGGIPLVRKTQVVSEHGEPMTWKNEGPVATPGENYDLCRCGLSGEKPFCDSTHCFSDFNGSETASSEPTASRQRVLGGVRITVKKDPTLCMDSGFCGLLGRGMRKLVLETADTATRSMVIAMVERCPSGSITYSYDPDPADIEPDLPQQIALSTEITSDGPIAGPYNVTGYIEIERSDGSLLEVRNRITLCNCGQSRNKPLCDGTHRREAERKAREGSA